MLRRGGRRRAAVAALLTVGLVVAGCGGGDDDSEGASNRPDDEPTESTTTTPETTTTAPPTAEDQALAVYRASHDVVIRAAGTNPPAYNDPALPEHFSGTALQNTVNFLIGLIDLNEYSQITRQSNPTVVTGNDSEVLLTDCVTETYQGFDSASGQPTEGGTVTISSRIRLVNNPAGWRVDEIIHEETPCS